MQKGQISFEYLVIIGFLLAVSTAFFVFSIGSLNDSVASSKARQFVETVAGYADFAAGSGEGTSVVFEADVPENIQSIGASGKSVSIVVALGGGNSEFYSYSKVNFTPVSLSTTKGIRKITLTFNDGNIMMVEA